MTPNIFFITSGERQTIACFSAGAPLFSGIGKHRARERGTFRRGMIEVYPQLANVEIEFVWGGTLDFAFDVMPHSGKLDDMYFAMGFAGHGVAAATWMGAKLAGVICGDADDNPFSKIPFPSAPSDCVAEIPGRFPWPVPTTRFWIGLPETAQAIAVMISFCAGEESQTILIRQAIPSATLVWETGSKQRLRTAQASGPHINAKRSLHTSARIPIKMRSDDDIRESYAPPGN